MEHLPWHCCDNPSHAYIHISSLHPTHTGTGPNKATNVCAFFAFVRAHACEVPGLACFQTCRQNRVYLSGYLCGASFKCHVSFSLWAHKHRCKNAYMHDMHTLQAQRHTLSVRLGIAWHLVHLEDLAVTWPLVRMCLGMCCMSAVIRAQHIYLASRLGRFALPGRLE